jgi:hypothetical protein
MSLLLEMQMQERWLEKDGLSAEFGDAISDLQGYITQLQMEYYKNSRNRNRMEELGVELLQKIKDRAEICLNRLEKAGPEDANESEQLGEEPATQQDVIRDPKIVKAKVPRGSFVQAGFERIGLENEAYLKMRGNRIAVKVRPNMVNSYHNASKGIPLLFSIEGVMHWVDEERGEIFFLSPFRLQNNASAIAGDLIKPDRQEIAKEKLLRFYDRMTSP